MVIHSNYTINLCNPPKSRKYINSINCLTNDLHSSSLIGESCIGVVLHLGHNIVQNNISDDQAINNYVNGLITALNKTPINSIIILETGASQGKEIGSRLEILAKIYHQIDAKYQKRINFCIDTCHIWASGYDISNENGVKKYFMQFDKLIGINKITCIHLNNSKTKLNSHVDRHADLAYGHINPKGLAAFTLYAQKYGIPIITETPLDAINPKTNHSITPEEEIELIKSWIKS